MIFGSKTPVERAKQAVLRGNLKKVSQILEKSVQNFGYKDPAIADLALYVASERLPFLGFLVQFLKEKPNYFGIHHRIAELYAEYGRFDEATFEARQLIKTLNRRGNFEAPDIRQIATYSHNIMTAAYTMAGARSYSKNLLRMGLKFCESESRSQKFLENEFTMLNKELLDPKLNALDNKWQEFFRTGNNMKELYDRCTELSFPQLAKRVELIESHFRFDAEYSHHFETEYLQEIQVFQDSSNPETPTYALR